MVDYDDIYALAAAAPDRLRGDIANLGDAAPVPVTPTPKSSGCCYRRTSRTGPAR